MPDPLHDDLRELLARRAAALTVDPAAGEDAIRARLTSGDSVLGDELGGGQRSRRTLLLAAVAAIVLVTGVVAGVLATREDADVRTAGRPVADDADQRYGANLTVLESPDHGPELCTTVAESYPPQCSGVPVVGWDWADVDGEESANGTTWGYFHVVGTFDGTELTLTEPAGPPVDEPSSPDPSFEPACDEPAVVDASHGGSEWEAMTQDVGAVDPSDLVAAWVSDPGGDWDGPFVGNLIVLPGTTDEVTTLVRQRYGGPLCVVERDGPTAAELAQVQQEVFDAEVQAALGAQGGYADERRGVVVVEVWRVDDAARAYAEDRWGELVELHGTLQPVG